MIGGLRSVLLRRSKDDVGWVGERRTLVPEANEAAVAGAGLHEGGRIRVAVMMPVVADAGGRDVRGKLLRRMPERSDARRHGGVEEEPERHQHREHEAARARSRSERTKQPYATLFPHPSPSECALQLTPERGNRAS